jgi:hypothetical protein
MDELQYNQIAILEGEKPPFLEKAIVLILRLLMWIHPAPFVYIRGKRVVASLNIHKVE